MYNMTKRKQSANHEQNSNYTEKAKHLSSISVLLTGLSEDNLQLCVMT